MTKVEEYLSKLAAHVRRDKGEIDEDTEARELEELNDLWNNLTAAEHDAVDAELAPEAQLSENRWTNRWPTEPGRYLFCCRIHGYAKDAPRLIMVDAHKNHTGHILFTGAGLILYPSEWDGIWQPYTQELPELSMYLEPPMSVLDQLMMQGYRLAKPSEESSEWVEVTFPSGAKQELRAIRLRLEVGDPK